jgi:hypothetical protein
MRLEDRVRRRRGYAMRFHFQIYHTAFDLPLRLHRKALTAIG